MIKFILLSLWTFVIAFVVSLAVGVYFDSRADSVIRNDVDFFRNIPEFKL